jgi:threonylcarbamoyladenosine tRNA methylthiotransferase MtaB
LKERLVKAGYEEAKGDEADLYFVNTCAVTAEAEKKDLQKVRRISRTYPDHPIYIMGCSSQIHKENYLMIDGVRSVTGTSHRSVLEELNKEGIRDYVEQDSRCFEYEDTPISQGEQNVRGYLKIQDGCDNFCSYCVVPFTRGKNRSRYSGSILKEAKTILQTGVSELVIGGIDVGSYKDPFKENYLLKDLLKDMLELSDKPYRIRVSSIEASQVDEDYIKLFKEHQDILCPHFHLPLQSGSEHVLQRMNRKYSLTEFFALTERLKKEIPGVALSTDVIAGFPGETEEEFKETYDFCKKVGFMRIHAFPYSERPFTMAAKLKNPVPVRIRMDRVKKLMELSDQNEAEYRKEIKGSKEVVLMEYFEKKEKQYIGYSQHYIRFGMDGDETLVGTFQEFIA